MLQILDAVHEERRHLARVDPVLVVFAMSSMR
jgi:hypothetical protein